MKSATCLAMLALLCAATGAAGDERVVYRSETQDGRVQYGDAPAAGARRSVRIQLERHAVTPQQEKAARRALALTRAQMLQDADARIARLRQLDNQASEAYEELKRAQEELERGREVQQEERHGRRLLAVYWERQRRLQNRLSAIQLRLENIVNQRAALQ